MEEVEVKLNPMEIGYIAALLIIKNRGTEFHENLLNKFNHLAEDLYKK